MQGRRVQLGNGEVINGVRGAKKTGTLENKVENDPPENLGIENISVFGSRP